MDQRADLLQGTLDLLILKTLLLGPLHDGASPSGCASCRTKYLKSDKAASTPPSTGSKTRAGSAPMGHQPGWSSRQFYTLTAAEKAVRR